MGGRRALQAPTCRAVGDVLIGPAVLCSPLLPVVVTHALIQPGLGSRAAVAEGAGPAANGGVAVVEVLRALETVPPDRPVQPPVAVLAAGPRPRRQPQKQRQQEPPAQRRPPRRTAAPPHGTARGRRHKQQRPAPQLGPYAVLQAGGWAGGKARFRYSGWDVEGNGTPRTVLTVAVSEPMP